MFIKPQCLEIKETARREQQVVDIQNYVAEEGLLYVLGIAD